MNKAVKTIIGLVLFAGLLFGAKTLYDNLSGNKKDQLAGDNVTSSTTADNTDKDTSKNTQGSTSSAPGTTSAQSTSAEPEKVYPLPEFTVYDKDSKEVKISSFKGKKLIINVWASWCGPCKSEMPDFAKIDQELKDRKDVEIVMINLTFGRETKETAESYLLQNNLTFRNMMFDLKQEAGMQLSVRSIPSTIFVKEYGNMYKYFEGAMHKDQVLQVLEEMK